MASSSASIPAVLVDTCVISGLARSDMKPEDSAAFCEMAAMVRDSNLTIWASTVARDEIDKVPPQFRQAHLDQYDALRTVRASKATWIDTNPASTGHGSVVQHPDYKKFRSILKDENDARLVFQAKAAGVTDFVTVDYRSVLNKASALSEAGIQALSPSQFIARKRSGGFAA